MILIHCAIHVDAHGRDKERKRGIRLVSKVSLNHSCQQNSGYCTHTACMMSTKEAHVLLPLIVVPKEGNLYDDVVLAELGIAYG